jgi:hypothetical protein
MATFARVKRTGQERTLRFVNELPKLHDTNLPERPSLTASFVVGARKKWRTVRIRPEIISIVEGLQARAARGSGVELSISEVLSALLVAGLPIVAEAPNGPFRR